MNTHGFTFAGANLHALPSGALWWPAARLLVISDLHLGKSERLARRGGALLPPYEVEETLTRLTTDIDRTQAREVICLGDSFDDRAAADTLPRAHLDWIARLQAGRRWIWIEGNHDPGPVALAGAHQAEHVHRPLTFRHIATPDSAAGEVSGHYHPKCRLALRGGRAVTRACFLVDDRRLILPAYGAYTGGLQCDAPVLQDLMARTARAILIGTPPRAVPMPQRKDRERATP